MSDIWIKLDVDFPDHPKILEVGPLVGWVYLNCLCWSRRYLTDGFISHAAMAGVYGKVEHLCGMELGSPEALASRLLQAGLLEAKDGGYLIHDYANHQQTKQMVQDRKAELSRIRSQAGRKGGEASGEARRSKTNHRERGRERKNSSFASQSNNEEPSMIDAVSACQHFIEGHAWDDSFDQRAIIEEFGRIERGRRVTGTIGSRELAGLLEQWKATRQDRYGTPAELEA